MPLEATMLVIDNSEYMRNGDYQPTRFEAQSDAVTTIFQTKIDANPENTVGVMTMAGKSPEVLVTHTKELGHVLAAIHKASTNITGSIDVTTAIAVAQLALKHRENKNLRQRIIVFVASPLGGAEGLGEKEMVKLAKKLKKNNVAVDVIAFGDGIEGGEKPSVLKAFVDAASSGDNSHLVSLAAGSHLLSDMILSSPVLAADRGAGIPPEAMGDEGAGASGASGSSAPRGAAFEFGVDPSLDPELAMALRMSMEEEASRQAAANSATAPGAAGTASSTLASVPESTPTNATTQTGGVTTGSAMLLDTSEEDEEEELALALAMSNERDVPMDAEAPPPSDQDDDMDEEEEIARAIQMSMEESKKK